MGFSVIGGSCLEVGVLDPSILKTERRPVTDPRSVGYRALATRSRLARSALPRERVRSLTRSRHARASGFASAPNPLAGAKVLAPARARGCRRSSQMALVLQS